MCLTIFLKFFLILLGLAWLNTIHPVLLFLGLILLGFYFVMRSVRESEEDEI